MLNDWSHELVDSKESSSIYESRAVHVHWDNGKECCLVTSIPQKIFDAHEIVKAYFDRWPYNEKLDSMMKAACCFYQVVGYGKKHVDNVNMLEQIKKYQAELEQLKQKLEMPLSQIISTEQKFGKLFETERKLFDTSKIKDGKRIQSKPNQKDLEECQREIRERKRQIKKIEEPFKKEFQILRKKSQEFARIIGQTKSISCRCRT